MPDVAASVLARLKNKANESGRTYQLCLQLFARRNFCADWKNPNMLKILYLRAVCSSIPLPILTVV